MQISVVIPTWEEENDIAEALKSLLHQTVLPDEIVVVDAQSEDRTVEIASQYTDKVFISEDRNIGIQRQQGLERAQGDVIVSCDADTFYPVDFIEKITRWFDDPEIVGVYGNIRPLNHNVLTSINCAFRNSFIARPFINRGVCFAFRKECCGEGYCGLCYGKGYGPVSFNEFDRLKKELGKHGKIIHDPEVVVYTHIPLYQQVETATYLGAGGFSGLKLIKRLIK